LAESFGGAFSTSAHGVPTTTLNASIVLVVIDDCKHFSVVDACSAWATRLDNALADLLVARHWLTAEDRAEVERLLERKLRKQGSRLPVDQAGSAASQGATPGPTDKTMPYISVLPTMKYERKTLHAEGGMGQIWRGYDPDLVGKLP
jgi:hypothetical protein